VDLVYVKPAIVFLAEKAGRRTGCGVRSQVIDVLKAQEIKNTGNEEGWRRGDEAGQRSFMTVRPAGSTPS